MKGNQALFFCPPGVGIRDSVPALRATEVLNLSWRMSENHHWQRPMHPVLFWCSVPARSPFHLAFRDWFGRPTFGFVSRAPLELMVDHHFPYYPDLTWPLCVSLVDKPWQTHLRERGWGWECSWSDFWVPSTVSFLVCCKRPSTSAVPKIHARAARAPVGSFKPKPGIP